MGYSEKLPRQGQWAMRAAAERMMERPRRSFPPSPCHRSMHRGFTLVEVMVALVIMSVAMVILLSTHAISTRTYAEAKAMTVCSMLAQKKLAELRAGELPPAGEASGRFEDNQYYQWTLSVKETEIEVLREVMLEVALIPAEKIQDAPVVPHLNVTTALAELGKPEEEEEGEQEKG